METLTTQSIGVTGSVLVIGGVAGMAAAAK